MASSAYRLGWLMAQLFDERRLQADELFSPPFNPDAQLPLVADLAPARKRELALADLHDLLADVASGASDTDVTAAGPAGQFNAAAFAGKLKALHQAILDQLVGDDQQISAYQLGLALSDTCWLATPEGGPQSFIAMFQRGQVASLKTWLASAGDMVPTGSAGIIGQSLDNWQDWIEVNAKGITKNWGSGDQAQQIVKALHIQAMAWHSVLAGDPQASGSPTMSAWIQAASSVVRAARKVTVSALRRFWWLMLIIAVVVAGVLVLVIVSLHGDSRVWASLLWVGGACGGVGVGVRSSVGNAMSGATSEVWAAARLDADAWNVTWLPALNQSRSQQRSLDRAGVAMPQVRANLEAAAAPTPAAPAPKA
ncbi:MAG: hypothetical protein JWM19_510 [Actinomycetia bacterium]|nr:hypothetical protein [Actinomycetes bacterium]